MRIWECACVIVLLSGQGLAGAATINVFKDGEASAIADLSSPKYSSVVEFRVPAECHILKATMNVSATGPEGAFPDYPENVSVSLEDQVLWSFNGNGFGPLGRQDRFLDGRNGVNYSFEPTGGSGNATVRLPKRAEVTEAAMDMACSGPYKFVTFANLSGGSGKDDGFGEVMSRAGDVNGDGYDDIIAGMPWNSMAGIFYGGPRMNSTPDINLTGDISERFGSMVACAGDVNRDGFDDIVVGAPDNATNGNSAGVAYMFFGGKNMDNTTDLIFRDSASYDHLGLSLSSAGDVNSDGYDDVIVGGASGGERGKVYIYFGGAPMDSVYDWYLNGSSNMAVFGRSVSGAGDVNGDGHPDFVVGATYSASSTPGKAFVFFGGPALDTIPDVTLSDILKGSDFGGSVSIPGDVNGDGYDDVLVGASYYYFSGHFGRAFLFLGGPQMDAVSDLDLTGEHVDDYFGYSVSGLGDIDRDGYDDYGISAPSYDGTTPNCGRLFVFHGGKQLLNVTNHTITGRAGDWLGDSFSAAGDVNSNGYPSFVVGAGGQANGYALVFDTVPGLKNPKALLGETTIFYYDGFFNATTRLTNLSAVLNDMLKSSKVLQNDSFGNLYVDLPLNVAAVNEGELVITNLSIKYQYNATTREFSKALGDYLAAHKNQKDAHGNIPVPLTVRSTTPGRVCLKLLNIVVDEGPVQISPIPGIEIQEDTAISEPVDLHLYFKDDFDSIEQLKFNLVSVTNSSIVSVELMGNKYLSVDAAEGKQNDNWTGMVEIVVNCTDRWGSMVESNLFRVAVANVPDAPVFTSAPPLEGLGGREYVYQATCEDGDAGDVLAFTLLKAPAGMAIDPASGRLSWVPTSGGTYPASVSVSDGMFNVKQDFTIKVANRVPRVANMTVPGAFLGEPYLYEIAVVDDDADALKFVLLSNLPGMTLDERSGLLRWVPGHLGTFAVTVRIDDGKESLVLDFNIVVIQGNRAPEFQSVPVVIAIEGLPYLYNASATDKDGDVLTYSLVSPPEGMAVDPRKGNVSWTPATAGKVQVVLKVSDDRGGEDVQQFTVNVSERVRPKVVVVAPIDGQKASGKLTVTGRTVKGTLDIVKVQVRVDSGDWADATGVSNWQLKLDTSKLTDGKHTLQVRAYDGMDYSEIVNRTITAGDREGSGSGIPGFGAGLVVMGLVLGLLSIARKKRGRLEVWQSGTST